MIEEGGQRAPSDETFAERLREALGLAATAGTIGSPVSHAQLLEMIVATAMHVLGARAGALMLKDEDAEELTFEVAVGGEAETVRKFRVPLGHGIAGFVAATGKPIAIADAQSDPRAAKDIAESVGYAPRTVLCVPLFYDDEVTGVLELLDKDNGESFTPEDMESLGLFARQAAVAIEQSRVHTSLAALLGHVLRSLGDGARGGVSESLRESAAAFAADAESDATAKQALELARLVRQIAHEGEHEARACRALLEGFADYLQARRRATGEFLTGGP